MHQGRKSQYLKQLQKYDFKYLLKSEKSSKIRLYLLAIEHGQKGKSICEVATIFNVHFNSVRSWIERFIKAGILGLKQNMGKEEKESLQKIKHLKNLF